MGIGRRGVEKCVINSVPSTVRGRSVVIIRIPRRRGGRERSARGKATQGGPGPYGVPRYSDGFHRGCLIGAPVPKHVRICLGHGLCSRVGGCLRIVTPRMDVTDCVDGVVTRRVRLGVRRVAQVCGSHFSPPGVR